MAYEQITTDYPWTKGREYKLVFEAKGMAWFSDSVLAEITKRLNEYPELRVNRFVWEKIDRPWALDDIRIYLYCTATASASPVLAVIGTIKAIFLLSGIVVALVLAYKLTGSVVEAPAKMVPWVLAGVAGIGALLLLSRHK